MIPSFLVRGHMKDGNLSLSGPKVGVAILLAGVQASAQIPLESPRSVLRDGTPSPQAIFGYELATDGRRLAVAASYDTHPAGIEAGSVTIFERDPTSGGWLETAVVQPWESSGHPPPHWIQFGWAVALDGNWLAISAYNFNLVGVPYFGRVYMYEETSPGSWQPRGSLPNAPQTSVQTVGADMELYGDHLFVGDPGFGSGWINGRVLYYHYDGTNWSYIDEVRGWPGAIGSSFGERIVADLGAGILAVSARREDHNGVNDAGAVHIVRLVGDGSTPYQLVYEARVLPSATVTNGHFGTNVAVLPNGRVVIRQERPNRALLLL